MPIDARQPHPIIWSQTKDICELRVPTGAAEFTSGQYSEKVGIYLYWIEQKFSLFKLTANYFHLLDTSNYVYKHLFI